MPVKLQHVLQRGKMNINLTIEGKIIGQKKTSLVDLLFDLPTYSERNGSYITLRDLLVSVVAQEVENFRQRQEKMNLGQILSIEAVMQGVEKGKVDSGGHDLHQSIDLEKATLTAIQAFEDNLYYVFIDGIAKTDLGEEIFLKTGSKVEFIRLVALAGG
jgi:hypothetical protein